MQDIIAQYLGVIPDAVKRLGDGVFVKVPLYQSQHTCRPIYINRAAYMEIFAPSSEPTWADMAQTLGILFSTTIEPEHARGEAVATAYVDRQSDPLDLSLSGNLGSGRAYYAGACFNIKGERTPLATAPKKQYSDGFLEMERAMWETLVGNGLQGAISTGLNGVLAIIDMDDTCTVGWRDHPVKRAKVIRLDNGCLDRVTHLFQSPRALGRDALHATAASYGRLEADKFCQRIEHGTWSPGNISLAGHLIDFDTVSATKGRGPLYSSTRWYYQNRFGYEHAGQATILDALAQDATINRDNVSAADLRATLYDTLARQTALNFIALMGFDHAETLYQGHSTEVSALCTLWQEIARKAYDCPDAFILKDTRAHHAHVFDTSLFMATYPLLRRLGQFDAAAALQAMMDDNWADTLMEEVPPSTLSEIERQHQDAVDDVIGEHLVGDVETRDMLSFAALSFIKKYDRLFQQLLQASGQDAGMIEAHALSRNEDRRTLFPALTATFRLAENAAHRSDEKLDSIMTSMVESCRQRDQAGAPVMRHAVYEEGHFYIALDGQGQHHLRFTAHIGHAQPTEIKWKNETIALDGAGYSAPRDNALLLPILTRTAPLQMPETSIYSQNEHIKEAQPATPL